MSCPVVKPESVTIPLSNGDYLVVKKRLNAGERQEMMFLSAKTAIAGEKLEVDPTKIVFTKPAIYLLDWSYTDLQGEPIEIAGKPVTEIMQVMRSFSTETMKEIETAVDAHVKEQDAAVTAKNSKDGETPSAATSPSVA